MLAVGSLFFSRGINCFREYRLLALTRSIDVKYDEGPDKKSYETRIRDSLNCLLFPSSFLRALRRDSLLHEIPTREIRVDRHWQRSNPVSAIWRRVIDPPLDSSPARVRFGSSARPAFVLSTKWISILSGSTPLVLVHNRSSCQQPLEPVELIS